VSMLPVLVSFTKKDLIDRYSGSILGGVWTLLMPLVNILIFTIVFSKVMGAKLSGTGMISSEYGYSLFLVSALLGWNAFSGCIVRFTSVYQDNAGILTKVPMSLSQLPLYIIFSESIIYMISMTFFVMFIYAIGEGLSGLFLLLPLVFLIQQIIAYGLGLFTATLTVFVKDVRELVQIIFHIWFWLTPIVYAPGILPEKWQAVMALNPAIYFTETYRSLIVYKTSPGLGFFVISGSAALLILVASLYFNRRLQRDIRDFL
jgi:lipopolysaccharide transport system permease protein